MIPSEEERTALLTAVMKNPWKTRELYSVCLSTAENLCRKAAKADPEVLAEDVRRLLLDKTARPSEMIQDVLAYHVGWYVFGQGKRPKYLAWCEGNQKYNTDAVELNGVLYLNARENIADILAGTCELLGIDEPDSRMIASDRFTAAFRSRLMSVMGHYVRSDLYMQHKCEEKGLDGDGYCSSTYTHRLRIAEKCLKSSRCYDEYAERMVAMFPTIRNNTIRKYHDIAARTRVPFRNSLQEAVSQRTAASMTEGYLNAETVRSEKDKIYSGDSDITYAVIAVAMKVRPHDFGVGETKDPLTVKNLKKVLDECGIKVPYAMVHTVKNSYASICTTYKEHRELELSDMAGIVNTSINEIKMIRQLK